MDDADQAGRRLDLDRNGQAGQSRADSLLLGFRLGDIPAAAVRPVVVSEHVAVRPADRHVFTAPFRWRTQKKASAVLCRCIRRLHTTPATYRP